MLEVENLTKHYGDLLAVDDLSFRIDEGEFGTLLGPSGCGKSTTLHTIAGLIEPSEGSIVLRGDDVTDQSPDERDIGMVFQSSATFPHMTVGENIKYGLKMNGFEPDEMDARINRYLELVQMGGYREHGPTELSGGQERRVSIARALAYEPDILLLDEPLTGLDRVLREELRNEIKRIQREVDVTTLYVTHDQEEALSMSDTILVLDDGEKQQEGGPKEIYDRPANSFVATFVGKSTTIEGTARGGEPPAVDTPLGSIRVGPDALDAFGTDDPVRLYVRPEDIGFADADSARTDGTNAIAGTVSSVEYLGTYSEIVVEMSDGTGAVAHTSTSDDVVVGEDVTLGFAPSNVIVLPPDG